MRAGSEAARSAGASRDEAEAAETTATRAACHCFAAPSVCSLHLSLQARQHTTSVVAGKDVIPRLCYASVRRLLRRLNNAAPSQPVMRAISAALGGRDKTNVGGEGSGLFADEDGGEGSGLFADEDGAASIAVRRPPLHDFGVESRVARHVSAPPSAGPSSESRCQGEWDDLEGNRGLELRDHAASDFWCSRSRDPPQASQLGGRTDRGGAPPDGVHGDSHIHANDDGPRADGVSVRHRRGDREERGGGGGARRAAGARRGGRLRTGDTPRTSRRRRRWRRRRRRESGAKRCAKSGARIDDETRRVERTTRGRSGGAGTRRRVARAERDDDDPGRRLWANVRRSLGIGVGVDDDRSESSSGRRRRGRRGDDSTDASEEDDIIAGLAELFGLDDDGEDDERDADGDGEFPGDGDGDGDGSSWDGSSSAPSTPRASPRARDGIARAPSWGLGRLGALIGKSKGHRGALRGRPRRRRRGRGVPATRTKRSSREVPSREVPSREVPSREVPRGARRRDDVRRASAGVVVGGAADERRRARHALAAASSDTSISAARARLKGKGADGADGVPR